MASRAITPPSLLPSEQGPTAKERKYDRQLRLWAANGQRALEEADILLLNSGAGVVGIETLKNLVLPGIGSFTIVDDALVSEADLGVNFFITEQTLGQSRAKATCELLKELNPEVNGAGVHQSVEQFIRNTDNLARRTLIILIGPSRHVSQLAQFCQTTSIPLIYIHCIGFYSHFSVQLPARFPIVETHPDPASTQDLRLLTPWPELVDFALAQTKDIDTISDHSHGHIPYLILLLHFLKVWRSTHDDLPPQNYAEKKQFTALISSAARTKNPEGGEENFDEAVSAVLKSLNEPCVSSGLQKVLDDPECTHPTATSSNFWIIANAIRSFITDTNLHPLPGSIPDMKAQSADYIALQNIYKSKARQDAAKVVSNVRRTESSLARNPPISEAEIEAFCKEAAFVRLVKGQSLHMARLQSGSVSPEIWANSASSLANSLQSGPSESLLCILIVFCAMDLHFNADKTEARSVSGPHSGLDFEVSLQKLCSGLVVSLAIKAGILPVDMTLAKLEADVGTAAFDTIKEHVAKTKSIVAEFKRAGEGTAELHNIAALTGGLVAQEIIKIVTKQYIPVDNTCVFDGIESKTAVFKL